MTACLKTQRFFLNGTSAQFESVLSLYDEALRLKAESKSSKPENVIKLDKWYQNELPKKIKSRGKDPHLTHEDLVQTIKWKLARGKFRPNLVNLVQMNTPRVVMNETKKAFRGIYKRKDLQAAASALCNLKGVGPAMASAVLAAGAPHVAPFMADECLLAMPDVDCIDYTMKEYMRFVEVVNATVERLNAEGGSWTPHKVEQTIWTYYITNDLKPERLIDVMNSTTSASTNGTLKPEEQDENSQDSVKNGNNYSEEDSNMSSFSATEDSNSAAPASFEDAENSNGNNDNGTTSSSNAEKSEEEIVTSPQNGENGGEEKDSSTTNGTSSSEQPKAVENGASATNGEDKTSSDSSHPSNPSTVESAGAAEVGEAATAESEVVAAAEETKALNTTTTSTTSLPSAEVEGEPAKNKSEDNGDNSGQKRSISQSEEEEKNNGISEQKTEEEPVAKKMKAAEEVATA